MTGVFNIPCYDECTKVFMDGAVIPLAHPSDPVAQSPAEPVISPGMQTYSRNVFIVGLSLAVAAGSGLLLPSYLSHHLSTVRYGAWILILQISSYVGLLDFGIQTAIAKYVAQHSDPAEHLACDRHASAGTLITFALGFVGLFFSVVLTLLVPALFRDLPPLITGDVVRGVFLVGSSTAVLLACSSFAAFFRGMQRYKVPTLMTVINKLVYVAILILLVSRHQSLTVMGIAVATLNLATAALQVVAWRVLLPQIHIRLHLVSWPIVKQMLHYCAVLGIWTSGMLIITGLDLSIVGHYDFAATAFYGVAATPVTFLLLMLQAMLNPLMPAVSALSVHRSAEHMGVMLSRSTRYTFLLLEMAGLPLILFGYFALTVWVGPSYALHSLVPMRLLILAHMLRNFLGPYATMVIATGRQKAATLSGVLEAVTNLVFSIVLGKYFGAVGVATGTLIGAAVGVLAHFVVSMRKTQGSFRISPLLLLRDGGLQPGIAALPTLMLLPVFWHAAPAVHTWQLMVFWGIATSALAWRFGLTTQERPMLLNAVRRLMFRPG